MAFMKHNDPDLKDRVIEVPDSAVAIHAASGWTLVEGDQKVAAAQQQLVENETKALRPTVEEGAVDPASVDKVAAAARRTAGKE